jgi:hypothetical protein
MEFVGSNITGKSAAEVVQEHLGEHLENEERWLIAHSDGSLIGENSRSVEEEAPSGSFRAPERVLPQRHQALVFFSYLEASTIFRRVHPEVNGEYVNEIRNLPCCNSGTVLIAGI